MEKHISSALEQVMENRRFYRADGKAALPIVEGTETPCISVAAPIVSAGDVLGCVIFAAERGEPPHGETEQKLVQTVSGFLGKQLEA